MVQVPSLRIVFMGTPSFAVSTLQALIHSPHHVIGVVTQPDRPVGRGYQIRPSSVKLVALEYDIPVFQPEKIRQNVEFHNNLQELAPDLIVVVAYGKILPPAILAIPRCGCLNVHASLLPLYRGAAPIVAAILHGDTETGITIMVMDEGMDTGPILSQKRISIGPATTADELGERLAQLGATMLLECLVPWCRGELQPRPQEHALATYAPLVGKDDGLVDWLQPADELERRWRAFYPWPGIFTYHRGRLLKILQLEVVSRPDGPPRGDYPGDGQPGEIIAVAESGLTVRCGRGAVLLLQVQPAGGRIMTGFQYANGSHLAPGERLTPPPAESSVSTSQLPS